MSSVAGEMGFFEKYAIKYYAFILNLVLYAGVYELAGSMEIVLAAVYLLPRIGSFLPKDNLNETTNWKQYNKTWFHMLAPVGSVLNVYAMIWYTWINYPTISHSYQSIISCLFAFSIAGGATIDACHELIHRPQILLRVTGFLGLVPFQFTTYPIEHLYLHHKYVGTPDDDITAPKNMPFYWYYIKSVFSSYRETFKYSKIFFAFCMILHMTYLLVLYNLGLREFNGDETLALRKMGFFLAMAFAALFGMQTIEYIEHYGLIYRKNNVQKPVLEISSWNTSVNPLYNWMTFRFQRHSDHHMNAYKTYTSLELNEKMPQFPFTFPQATGAALVPPIWYKIADHLSDRILRHEKFTKQDLEKTRFWMYVSNSITFLILGTNICWAMLKTSQGMTQ